MATFNEFFLPGRKAKDEKRFEDALPLLAQAAELEPKTSIALQAMVQCLTELGRHAEAIEAAQKAVAIEPDDQFAYISLSRAYQRGGFIPEAEYAKAKSEEARWKAQQAK